ncbi:ksdD-like steroid dehydrogenase [Candidatus Magnetomorum sp. HK-1]|nr:ksdD-like steroid dehydrogenase [Candidatus Magnetomorum sp. HK-1]
MQKKQTYAGDIVIIGGGLAGLTVALELLDHNFKIVMIDRDQPQRFGGLARESFGGVLMVNTPVQRRMGIRDNVELARKDWMSFAGFGSNDIWPKRWMDLYLNQSIEDIYEWLRQRGVSFFPVVHWVERGYHIAGNSVPRFHMVWGTGKGLIESLIQRLNAHPKRKNLTIHWGHRVNSLEMKNGIVSGCTGVIEPGGELFDARSDCVVVATGGINGSLESVRDNWHSDWGAPPKTLLNGSHMYAVGDLHQGIEKIGGKLTHLDLMWNYAAGVSHPNPRMPFHGLSVVPPRSALWLNYQGRRIGPPHLMAGFDTRYMIQQICREPYQYSWHVMNYKIAVKELAISGSEHNKAIANKDLIGFLKDILLGNPDLVNHLINDCEDVVVADTIDELAEKMNALEGNQRVDQALLQKEIEYYDQIIEKKDFEKDDQLKRLKKLRQYRGDRARTCQFQPIMDKKALPLIAMRYYILSRKSLGGIQTDLQSRVLSKEGTPLSGLYAVGEAAGFGGGGIHGKRALEGTFLGSCILTGRAAARSIISGAIGK